METEQVVSNGQSKSSDEHVDPKPTAESREQEMTDVTNIENQSKEPREMKQEGETAKHTVDEQKDSNLHKDSDTQHKEKKSPLNELGKIDSMSKPVTDTSRSFKMPLLIGPRPGVLKQHKSPNRASKVNPEIDKEESENKSTNLPGAPPVLPPLMKALSSPEKNAKDSVAPYKEPSWGGLPSQPYSFEVLKGGIILSNVELGKSYCIVGRMEGCDIILEHPSVSRYHAVIQYRAVEDKEHYKGFYIYDLESTHGTFLNKNQLRPRIYTKLNVGHMLKFGGSSRMYILQGPSEDEEEESALSVTEIKNLRMQQEEMVKIKMEEEEKAREEKAVKAKEEGVDWGMGEDAEEEEISTENPFALSTPNEDLYLDDPKKTLRGWFEREGYELEYDVEEKGFGQFTCRIELPIDTPTGEPVVAEVTHKGKKKEAVVAGALEACRILDRYGALRQSHHEGRKRKQKNWEADDFYDSDEDTYLDRTGTIEMKREMRKKMAKKEEVETYDSLVKKLEEVDAELQEIYAKLGTNKQTDKGSSDSREDSLDAFMDSLKSQQEMDKVARSKLRQKMAILLQERVKLSKLANIAKPASLPPLASKSMKELTKTTSSPQNKALPMTGTMKGHPSRKKKPVPQFIPEPVDYRDEDENVVEEEEEEDEEEDKIVETEHREDQLSLVKEKLSTVCDQKAEQENSEKVVKGPSRPLPEMLKKTSSEESPKKEAKKESKKAKSSKKTSVEYDASNPDYHMWMPPAGQSGDGKTHLNEKYGY